MACSASEYSLRVLSLLLGVSLKGEAFFLYLCFFPCICPRGLGPAPICLPRYSTSSCSGVGLRRVSSCRPATGSPEISCSLRFLLGAAIVAAVTI
jgi:hypothetical protein